MKISEFVMANEVKGIPVEMAKFTSCLPHLCTVENSCTSQRGFITPLPWKDAPRTNN